MTTNSTARSLLNGRHSDPHSSPRTDPRMDPRLLAGLAPFGLDGAAGDPPVTRSSDPADIGAFLDEAHANQEMLFNMLPAGDPHGFVGRVSSRVISIPGVDGNDIDLHVFAPDGLGADVPAVVYIHGGGMAYGSVDNNVTVTWCREIAGRGQVAIAVDFRNSHVGGPHPFPAGLNDCISAVKWIDQHRGDLGISRIVLQGESGGANLSIATALSARRDGWSDVIAGLYLLAPYISGAYGWPEDRKLAELPSLVENDGYLMTCGWMDVVASRYDPEGLHTENPLAWPYFAEVEDLEGLPPHVVAVDELDPLRDEGIAYVRKLKLAGVPVVGRVNLGMIHSTEIMRDAASDYFDATVDDIYRFASSL